MMLGLLTVACNTNKESTLTYPAAVVAVHQEQHYRTALWYAYTKGLDSAEFKKRSQLDSVQALQRRLLTIKRHLEQIEERGESICFKFSFDFKSPAEIAFMEKLCGYSCGYNPRSKLSPVAAVWVNKRDGLIDSIQDYNNVIYSAGPPPRFPSRQEMSWNKDQPYKATFLRQNKALLSADLLQLCWDKHIISR